MGLVGEKKEQKKLFPSLNPLSTLDIKPHQILLNLWIPYKTLAIYILKTQTCSKCIGLSFHELSQMGRIKSGYLKLRIKCYLIKFKY